MNNEAIVVSRQAYISSALLGMCVLVGFLVSCGPNPRMDQDAKNKNMVSSQLRSVIAAIELALLNARQSGNPIEFEHIIADIVKQEGVDVFRCPVQTNAWLHICPDTKKWLSFDGYNDEIAIYDPTHVFVKSLSASKYIAMTFGGKEVYITKLPEYQPVDIQKWVRSDSHKN